jgi:hypothetical protein
MWQLLCHSRANVNESEVANSKQQTAGRAIADFADYAEGGRKNRRQKAEGKQPHVKTTR